MSIAVYFESTDCSGPPLLPSNALDGTGAGSLFITNAVVDNILWVVPRGSDRHPPTASFSPAQRVTDLSKEFKFPLKLHG
jgi:hypothetical protein